MDFRTNKLKHFKINDEEFSCHKDAIKKAAMFKVLLDKNIQVDKVPEFKLQDAKLCDISLILNKLYNEDFDCKKIVTTTKDVANIVSIMTHMAVNNKIIVSFIDETLGKLENTIIELLDVEYHDSLNIIIDNYKPVVVWNKDMVIKIADIVKTKNFLDEFKIKIITKLICFTLKPETFDFVFGVNAHYAQTTQTDLRSIINMFSHADLVSKKESWITPVAALYQEYFDIKVKVGGTRDTEYTKIISVTINGNKLELIKIDGTHTKGTTGSNTMMTVVTHIARVLLGLDKLE